MKTRRVDARLRLTTIKAPTTDVREHRARHEGREVIPCSLRDELAYVGARQLGEQGDWRASVGDARSAEDDWRREPTHLVEAEPFVRLEQDVSAHDEAKTPIVVGPAERLQRVERQAVERLFDARDLDVRQVLHRELAHANAVVERCERLSERMFVRRHDDQPIDLARRQHVCDRQNVPDVRGIKAAAEHCDGLGHWLKGNSSAASSATQGRVTVHDPVRIRFDGDDVTAERGEPVAAALVRAGILAIARSPKFHRPRGPSCFRSACDGCLARVDGVPNVMTCMTEARDGMVIEAQNTLGSRDTDLLRVTDWFFPEGMNHHELFAGVPGVQQVMQVFARRVAGLGRIPTEKAQARPAVRRAVDALVVGAGPSGIAAAVRLRELGRDVEIVDDALEPGGSARATFDERFDTLIASLPESGATLRLRTTVAGIYGDDVLVVSPTGAEIVTARTLVLATGAHDGVLAFEGNDLPGVMSARAGAWLLGRGVHLGERVVVAIAPGGGPFGEAYARVAKNTTVVHAPPTAVEGSTRVKRVAFGDKDLPATALLVDAPRAPAYELAEQVGATLAHEPRGYVVRAERGRIREGVFAVGEVTGCPLDLDAIVGQVAQLEL